MAKQGYIVVYNSGKPSVALLELTYPLDSEHNIQSAKFRKQNKAEYHQLLAEFDHLATDPKLL